MKMDPEYNCNYTTERKDLYGISLYQKYNGFLIDDSTNFEFNI